MLCSATASIVVPARTTVSTFASGSPDADPDRFRRMLSWDHFVARFATIVAPVQRGWIAFTEWFNGLALSENAVFLGFAVAIGLLSALGVAAFYKSIDLAYDAFYRFPATLVPRITFLAYR